MRYGVMLIGLFCNTVLHCDPIWVVNSNIWDKNTKVFLGNGEKPSKLTSQFSIFLEPPLQMTKNSKWLEVVHVGAPEKHYKHEGYKTFKLNHKNRIPRLYGLLARGVQDTGVLVQLDGMTGKAIQQFPLSFPIQQGILSVSDVFFAKAWHTVLALIIKHPTEEKTKLLLFDVTNPTQSPEEYLNITLEGKVTTPPCFVRLNKEGFGIALGITVGKDKMLRILPLEKERRALEFALGEGTFLFLSAIDLRGEEYVDRMYAGDAKQIWAIDVTNYLGSPVKKLANIECLSAPKIVKDVSGIGVRLYLQGKSNDTVGLFIVHDTLKEHQPLIGLIAAGNYLAFEIRSGHLIVVSKAAQPFVFTLPLHSEVVTEQWNLLISEGSVQEVMQAKLLWDPKEGRETLLTLNASYQLNIFAPAHMDDHYGRVVWRKRW